MKLHVSGYMPRKGWWKTSLAEYAREQAEKLLADHSRIKRVRVTFCKDDPNWAYGFHWLVRYDQVEIIIPQRFRDVWSVKWLIRHELLHARQILEGRVNRNLDLLKFTNRRGVTRTFKWVRKLAVYVCVENGRRYVGNEPWELEVINDDDKLDA